MTFRRFLVLAAVLVLVVVGVCAQEEESLDSLFDAPAEDSVVASTAVDHLSQYVTNDRIKFSGYFDAEGGVGAGWTSWPILSDPAEGFEGTIGLIATANLYFDARPDPDFRFYGYVTTSMNPVNSQYAWSGFSIGELFIDYTLLDTVFIRMGQHDIAWGQARLFEGVTDLMSDVSSGFSLRASLPTLLDGVSAIGFLKREFVTAGAPASYQQICYALKADKVVAGTFLSLGARYQASEGLNAIMSIKKVLLGIDLLSDVVIHYDPSSASWYPRALAGFYKEWQDIKLYGEYYYNGSASVGLDHSAGLALGLNNIIDTPIDLGIQWIHAFIDGSGSATAGLTWKPWKYITATIAMPIAYGGDGSRYVAALNEDAAKRRLALVFGLELEVSF